MKSNPGKTGQDACQVMAYTVQGRESGTEFLRRHAVVFLRQALKKYRRLRKPHTEERPQEMPESVTSPLAMGDVVRIRPLAEIEDTLDHFGAAKGCVFMKQQAQYCGQQCKVAGSLAKFYDEARCRTLKCKNLFLLDGLYCDGSGVGGCDRRCFLFWRREWLEKVS